MQYVVFSFILIFTLIIGILLGLYIPVIVLKYYKPKTEEKKEVQELENITKDIMNEWMNGKGE